MALPSPKIHELKQYLKKGFSLKEDWVSKEFDRTYPYSDVKEYLGKIKRTDPELFRLLGWVLVSNRPRNEVAGGLYMDPSTLKRKQDRAMHILLNYLNNGDLDPALNPIDLIYQMEENA